MISAFTRLGAVLDTVLVTEFVIKYFIKVGAINLSNFLSLSYGIYPLFPLVDMYMLKWNQHTAC